jgi:hypothetical protein
MKTKLFEVQEYTIGDGWVNNWRHEQDGSNEPLQFNSEEAALKELDEFLYDMLEAEARGYVEDTPTREEFRIVEVP